MKILNCYYSLGNNTKVSSERVRNAIESFGGEVTELRLQNVNDFSNLDIEQYDLVFIGSPTYGRGITPEQVKNFLRYVLKDNEFNLPPFAVYGTGDTQWGDLLYCRAVDEIKWHLEKRTKVVGTLKIEQRPTSNLQINKINNFVEVAMKGEMK